jgi:predicted NBD/HSP70 family sugar kinase
MPSLSLLRSLSDEAVLRALMKVPRSTRAELAAVSGLSKPTVAEAIRRLEAAGLVRDTGERTSGRGGVGSYYALSENSGVALAVSIAPEGVVAETLDAHGAVQQRVVQAVQRPATPRSVTRLLQHAAQEALRARPAESARLAVVSAADPVDRTTGNLVQLPDAPFLLGAMSPASALRRIVDGPVLVDNDVNWAARAERDTRLQHHTDLQDFAYLYLGEGLGCAVVADGEVRRGHRGIAGEIAHVPVPGPNGNAVPFTSVFAELDLRYPGSTAINVAKLLTKLDSTHGADLRHAVAHAVTGVLNAVTAFCDPELIVIGGPWGSTDGILDALRRAFNTQPRSVPLEQPLAVDEPSLAGARTAAINALRTDIIKRSAT